MRTVAGWWLPPALRRHVSDETVMQAASGLQVRLPVLTPDALTAVARGLREARARHLADLPVARIVESLERVASAWLVPSPMRDEAERAVAEVTGFSLPVVHDAVTLEQASSRAAHQWRALRSELGDPEALDRFVPSPHLGPGGRVRALGPGLCGAIFSSNIPALPHLGALRSLLVKAAFLGRSSRGEPTFLPAWLDSLDALAPDLAACCGVLWWPREDRALEAAFLDGLDFLVGWGGREAEAHVRQVAPRGLPMLFHGHRVGVAVVLADAPWEGLARGLALDVCRFDQHACLSPQVVLVEGHDACDRLAGALARALDDVRRALPPRALGFGDRARRSQLRGVAELEGAQVRGPSDGSWAWTLVVLRDGPLPPSPLDRWISLVPVRDVADALARLEPWRGLLQNVAVAGGSGALREGLARLGATRVCPPGQMATPSMMWHHDGHACLAAMVRWCDEEQVLPERVET